MRNSVTIATLLLIIACAGIASDARTAAIDRDQRPFVEEPQRLPNPGDTSLARRRTIFDSLVTALRSRTPRSTDVAWSEATFPRSWTMLAMTDTAFVQYDMCDGRMPTIDVDADTLEIFLRWEPVHLAAPRIAGIAGDHARIEASLADGLCGDPPSTARFDIRLLDRGTGLALWEWTWRNCGADDTRRWLMVPTASLAPFATVERRCEERKLDEHEFLALPFSE